MTEWVVVFVCYDDNPCYLNYVKDIKHFLLLKKIKNIVIANTKLEEVCIFENEKKTIVKIDNLDEEMEFSGYYYGLNFYSNKNSFPPRSRQSFILLNDTLFKHGKLRKVELIALWEWKIKTIFKRKRSPGILGFWHSSFFLKNTEMSNGYFNSKFLLFENISLHEFRDMINLGGIDVKIDSKNKYRNNIFPSKQYSTFLSEWLNGKDGWYKANELNHDNKNYFLRKARSIIHEHYISKYIENTDYKITCMIKSSLLAKLLLKVTRIKY